jgi:hypothetical protein
MSGDERQGSWSHSCPSEWSMLIVDCPCGLRHEVMHIKDGGMSVVDCVCGRAIEIGHPIRPTQGD